MHFKNRILLFLLLCLPVFALAQEPTYDIQVVSCIESLVPGGLGRSRMISPVVELDYRDFTSKRTADNNSKNQADRQDIRLKDYEETKLLNLYNEGGIRFQNVASNDALMTSKINDMLANGWELFDVKTGVESNMANASLKKELIKLLINNNSMNDRDPNGLFITRFYFRKAIQK